MTEKPEDQAEGMVVDGPARKQKQPKKQRRRKGSVGGRRKKLQVHEESLDRENYAYRWIVDDGRRVHDMTDQDDWDIVPNRDVKDDATDIGSSVSVLGNKTGDNGPQRLYLVRKPREYFEEDTAVIQAEVDKRERSIKRTGTTGSEGLSVQDPHAYGTGMDFAKG